MTTLRKVELAPAVARATVVPFRVTRVVALFVVLTVALVAVTLWSTVVGQYGIGVGDVVGSIVWHLSGPLHWGSVISDPFAESTLWKVRLPRVALSVIVGAVLASAGAVMQGVFGNPLAEPAVVGVSSGAAVGAALMITTGTAWFGVFSVPIAAFVTGLASVFIVYLLSRSAGRTEVVTLVLTGIAVNAVAGAVLAFSMFTASQTARDEIVFWQLGSLAGSRWSSVAAVLPFAFVGLVGAALAAKRLDLLALGDRAARQLGLHVERFRLVAVVLVALMVSAAVAFSGVIGFVGLVVPHVVRMVVGPGHRVLVPASVLGGAVLLALADLGARTLVQYADLPIGMLTALVGGPFFFWLIRRTRRRAGGWA